MMKKNRTYTQSVVSEGVVARQAIPSAVQFLYEITKKSLNIENTKKHYPNKEDLYKDIVNAYKKVDKTCNVMIYGGLVM